MDPDSQAREALRKVVEERFTNFDAGAVVHWAERGRYQVKADAQAEIARLTAERDAALASVVLIDVATVSEVMEDGAGIWRSCSGCTETSDGVSLGTYSSALNCHLGVGCGECGGIGAVWDTTDYADMAKWLAKELVADVDQESAKAARDMPGLPHHLTDILGRATRAMTMAQELFPAPNYTLLKVAEEAGEVVKAAIHYGERRGSWSDVEDEAVQAIAMILRLLDEGDAVNGILPPARAAEAGHG